MDDELREMVLNAVFLLYKGKGIMSHPRVKVNSRLIVEQISASTGKEIDRDNIRTAIFELCQGGYLKEHIERSSFKSKNPFTGKTETVKDQHSMYSIKEKGIVHIEGESKFLKEKGTEMVNIKNINISHVNAPIAIGKDITININQNYNELHQHLKALSEAIQNSGLIEEDKKDSLAEIITIDTQLSKRAPNKDIIRESWNALEKIVMANDLWDLIEKIKPMIVSLLGS